MRLFDPTILKRTVRTLRRSPGFVVVSVLSLGVSLGLATATFAIVDSALHPRALFRDPGQVAMAMLRWGNQHSGPTIAEQMRGLESLPAVQSVGVETSERELATVSGGSAQARVAQVVHVSPNLFPVLGIPLKLGRYPTPAEVAAGGAVLMSDAAWTDAFGGRPAIDGATLKVGGQVYSVVGVVPHGNAGPLSGAIIVPFASHGDVERLRQGSIIVKLRSGVDSASLRAQLATLASRYDARYVSRLTITTPYRMLLSSMAPYRVSLRNDLEGILMLALALGMLLIGCTNVTALALARGLTRRRDHALRIALGAPRAVIGTEVLSEVLVLGALGAVLGVLVAKAVVGILTHLVPADVAAAGYYVPGFSPWVFAMAGIALLGGMLVAGGVPAWRASRLDPADPLKDNAGTTTGRSRNEFRILVISELAIAMVLLMLTSLVALSTRNLANYTYGYDAQSLLRIYAMPVSGTQDTVALAADALQARMLQTVRDVPGVVAAASVGYAVPEFGSVLADERASIRLHYYVTAGAGFFATTGIRLLNGRDLSEADLLGDGAAVLSRTAARELFPHGDAMGHMIKLGTAQSAQPWYRVVGIAADVSMSATDSYDPEENPLIFVAVPHQTHMTDVVARTSAHAGATLSITLMRVLAEVLPSGVATSVMPWTYGQLQAVRANRVMERLLSMLSFAALILGVTGLFSVLSYSVGQRMREFAVRQALGATPRNIVRVVLTGAFEMALGGTAIGALLSFWASAGISWRLFGVKNTDPVSLVVAEATLLTVALTAALVPAFRAMRSDPVEILRSS